MLRTLGLLRKIRTSLFDTLDSLLLMLAAIFFLTFLVSCGGRLVENTPETPAGMATAAPFVTDEAEQQVVELDQSSVPVSMPQETCDQLGNSPAAYPTTPYFVDCQVILTGWATEIQHTVAALEESDDFELELLGQSDLSHLLEPDYPEVSDELASPMLTLAQQMPDEQPSDQLLSAQYRISSGPGSSQGGEWVYQVLNRVNEEHVGEIETVYADPNYLIGILTDSPCSNPFGATGSPFGATGSPFGATGSPSGGMGVGANPDQYLKQGALEDIGVVRDGDRALEYDGEGVLVGVFDTSPFEGGWPNPIIPPEAAITEVTSELSLEVLEPPLIGSMMSLVTSTVPQEVIREHGVFVAGLVRAVAPESEIQLIRVLSDWGCGDLFTLADGVNQFVRNVIDLGDPPSVVINMSLGVAYPPPSESEGFPPEIVALEASVAGAHIQRIVLVAAAGNDSTVTTVAEMNYPALYSEVIGVAAVDDDGARSCFSNRGDVRAPGGDGEPGIDSAGREYCIAMAATCPPFDMSDASTSSCSWGLTSIVSERLMEVYLDSTGYAYWAGTSFATPLVSGQAALLLGTGASRDDTWTAILTTSSPGIVDIPASLNELPHP